MINGNLKKWGLKVEPKELRLQERKDVMIFLSFLNVCEDYECALQNFKEMWLNNVYELPATNDENYNSVKCSRHLALKRVKEVYSKYIIKNY